MINNFTPFHLAIFALVTVIVTLFNLAIVILEDPPAFFGYVFGIFTGANITALLALFLFYREAHP